MGYLGKYFFTSWVTFSLFCFFSYLRGGTNIQIQDPYLGEISIHWRDVILVRGICEWSNVTVVLFVHLLNNFVIHNKYKMGVWYFNFTVFSVLLSCMQNCFLFWTIFVGVVGIKKETLKWYFIHDYHNLCDCSCVLLNVLIDRDIESVKFFITLNF